MVSGPTTFDASAMSGHAVGQLCCCRLMCGRSVTMTPSVFLMQPNFLGHAVDRHATVGHVGGVPFTNTGTFRARKAVRRRRHYDRSMTRPGPDLIVLHEHPDWQKPL